jgi:hypothetical protein
LAKRHLSVREKNQVANPATFSEAYTNDQLNQLVSFQRGTLNAQHTIDNPTRSLTWGTDGAGNLTNLPSPTGQQTLAYNRQNEISTSGYAYDGNGNLTGDGTNNYFYDAWNRLLMNLVAWTCRLQQPQSM